MKVQLQPELDVPASLLKAKYDSGIAEVVIPAAKYFPPNKA